MKKIKITLSVLLLIVSISSINAHPSNGIFEGDVTLTTQAEVDAFSFMEVTGILTISGHDISNLDGLSQLTKVGRLKLTENPNLTHVAGLSALSQIGIFIEISDNPVLKNLDGLSSVTGASGCRITIRNNALLETINGFSMMSGNLLAIRISNNPQLKSFNGFKGIRSLGSYDGGELIIDNNASLTNVDGLASLFSFGGKSSYAQITNNASLLNIDGLSSLHHIGGTVTQLTISNNQSLKNLNGLKALTYIGTDEMGSLIIQNNFALEDIDGLMNLRHGLMRSSSKIIVTNNSSLSRCSGLLPLLLSLGLDVETEFANLGNIDVSENGAGCTLEDILSTPQICQGDVVLSSQAEVDAFFCAKVIGNLTISGSDIADLNNLSLLTKVTGNLNIEENPNLESLEGLIGLDTVGGILKIQSDQVLSNIDALNALTSVGSLFINNNPVLLDIGLTAFGSLMNAGEFVFDNNANLNTISGFNSLASSRSITISNNPKLVRINAFNSLVSTRSGSLSGPGSISIHQNDALTDLDCFSALTSVGDIRITMNSRLPSVDGFSSVSTLYGMLEIQGNASLKSFNGFQGLTLLRSVQREVSEVGIIISNNPSLESLTGLSSLKTIDSQYENRVEISNNPSLKSIDGLSSLASIAGEGFLSFQIKNNATLDNIDGLLALTNVGAVLGYFNITISQNPSLTQCCALRPLLEHLDERFNLDTLIAKEALVISENGGCSVDNIILCGPQKISNLDVIDLRTGQKVYTFYNDSVTFDLAYTDPKHLGIQAHTLPSIVASVEFSLGKIRHTENNHPYLFDPPRLDPGIYIVKADVYSKPNKQGVKGIGKTLTIIVTNSAAVESYELVNAIGKPIKPLQEGDKINIKDVLFSKSVHIRAHVSDNHITSVRFFLNGVFVRREMSAPFAFNGNNDEAYYPWKPQPGAYTIKAVPYVIRDGKEYEGKSLEINFTVEDKESPIAVVGFDAVDLSGNLLAHLYDGDQINIKDPTFQAINIIANTSGEVGSVNFWLNNKSYRTENGVPYTLAGDQNGKFNVWSPQVGDYTLTAIPHSESNAKGTIGKSLTIQIKVVAEKVGAVARLVTGDPGKENLQAETGDGLTLYPVPVDAALFVKMDGETGRNAVLTIVNIHGITVHKDWYSTSQTINTQQFKPGVYFLYVSDDNGFRRVIKFIKQ